MYNLQQQVIVGLGNESVHCHVNKAFNTKNIATAIERQKAKK